MPAFSRAWWKSLFHCMAASWEFHACPLAAVMPAASWGGEHLRAMSGAGWLCPPAPPPPPSGSPFSPSGSSTAPQLLEWPTAAHGGPCLARSCTAPFCVPWPAPFPIMVFLWQGVAEEYNRLKELKQVSPLARLPHQPQPHCLGWGRGEAQPCEKQAGLPGSEGLPLCGGWLGGLLPIERQCGREET